MKVRRLPVHRRQAVLRALAQGLAARDDVVFAYAHGSFLGDVGFRDIDVAVWTVPDASRRLDLELAVSLSQLVGYAVDVRAVNHAPVSFLFRVLRGHLLVVRDEHLLADLIERTARVYHDRAPLVRLATREAFA